MKVARDGVLLSWNGTPPTRTAPAGWRTPYVYLSDTNLLSVFSFGWQQPRLLRKFMISQFNGSLLPKFGSIFLAPGWAWRLGCSRVGNWTDAAAAFREVSWRESAARSCSPGSAFRDVNWSKASRGSFPPGQLSEMWTRGMLLQGTVPLGQLSERLPGGMLLQGALNLLDKGIRQAWTRSRLQQGDEVSSQPIDRMFQKTLMFWIYAKRSSLWCMELKRWYWGKNKGTRRWQRD